MEQALEPETHNLRSNQGRCNLSAGRRREYKWGMWSASRNTYYIRPLFKWPPGFSRAYHATVSSTSRMLYSMTAA